MKKRIKLFIIITLLTVLIGWSIYSFYLFVWNKVKQNIQDGVLIAIVSQVQDKGEVTIFLSDSQITLVRKITIPNIKNIENEE